MYQFILGWTTLNIIMKPTNSPTQDQPNPIQFSANPVMRERKRDLLSWTVVLLRHGVHDDVVRTLAS